MKTERISRSELIKKSKKVRDLIVARISILVAILLVSVVILSLISYFFFIKPGLVRDDCYKQALDTVGKSLEGTAGFNFLLENCLQQKELEK